MRWLRHKRLQEVALGWPARELAAGSSSQTEMAGSIISAKADVIPRCTETSCQPSAGSGRAAVATALALNSLLIKERTFRRAERTHLRGSNSTACRAMARARPTADDEAEAAGKRESDFVDGDLSQQGPGSRIVRKSPDHPRQTRAPALALGTRPTGMPSAIRWTWARQSFRAGD